MLKRLPPDNYPDSYESRTYQHYRPWLKPGLRLWLVMTFPRFLAITGVLALIVAGGIGALFLMPPPEPQVIVITVPPSPDTLPTVGGNFPQDMVQQYIRVPARIDHEMYVGERHAYRFFLDPPGVTWIITFITVTEFDSGMISFYSPDGTVIEQKQQTTPGETLTITYTATDPRQFGLVIAATNGINAGGYTLTIMPQR